MKRIRMSAALLGAAVLSVLSLGAPASAAESTEAVQHFVISSKLDPNQVLDARGGATTPGTDVITYSYHGGSNQLWRFIPRPNGTVAIAGKASDLCVTASQPYGGKLTLERCSPFNLRQRFIQEAPSGGVTRFESAIFPGQYIDMGLPDESAVLEPEDRSPSQSWSLVAH